MIYPKDFENKIGFTSIRGIIKELCVGSLGKEHVNKIKFTSNKGFIQKQLNQTDDFRQILLYEEPLSIDEYIDISSEIEKLNIEGTFIEVEVLFELKRILTIIYNIDKYIKNLEEEKYFDIKELYSNIYTENIILQKIDRIIDDKCNIKDDASPALSKIRKDIAAKMQLIEKRMASIFQNVKKEGWITENSEISVRNGRAVIPINAAHKKKIKGIIHDESATGQTIFIEPSEIFEINNSIRELENVEKREIVRILTEFTDFLRPNVFTIIEYIKILGYTDFIRAKALFALKTEAYKPILVDKPHINLVKSRHPLLYLSHKESKKHVEPLNILLDSNSRILVVSGPNAGGKSVCLKTVGLLQFMVQSGLLIPALEYSEMGIFENIFIDIGDQQSIEDDLSTYSSHLLNMTNFLKNSNNKTLFLIDEFGSGTEPQIGGAIAESILLELNKTEAFGIITTHYANLKLLAGKINGIVNGAMLFDLNNLQPLYKLKIGRPGSSFAFEIAQKIGLPKNIIDAASSIAGDKFIDLDRQLQLLEIEKIDIERKQEEFKVADDFLAEMIEKYQNLLAQLENDKKTIINNAKIEAKDLLDNTNKIIEYTIREIKEKQAEKEFTKDKRSELEQFTKTIDIDDKIPYNPDSRKEKKKEKKQKPIKKTEEPIIEKTPITLGDSVRISGQEVIGEVLEIKDNNVSIVFGNIKTNVSLNQLEKINKSSVKNNQSSKISKLIRKYNFDITEKVKNFKTSIDVRGKRADEIYSIITQYIDEAILLNVPEVYILHGKGNGVLRNIIREYLSTVEEIKSFKDEHIERGGSGITIVNFRN